MQATKGHQLENIITRFYYKQKELYFQIILQLAGKEVVYNEYSDYTIYKSQLQNLVKIKESNGMLHLDGVQNINYTLVN